jgi:hypothetical protein
MTKSTGATRASNQRQRPSLPGVEASPPRARRRPLWWTGSAIAAIVISGIVVSDGLSGGGIGPTRDGAVSQNRLGPLAPLGSLTSPESPGASGPEGVPIPAGRVLASPMATGQAIDAVQCSAGEQVAFHIHAHLTIFINGVAEAVPAAIGIANPKAQSTPEGPFIGAGSCFYWLHTHAADGIIHVESPVATTFILGQFFDIWGQSLGKDHLGSITDPITAFYNGQHWTADPQDIPLNAHAQIQLDIGSPLVGPESIRFPDGL